MTVPHVLIAGGGITGLSTAFYLERHAAETESPIAITIVEPANRLGGKLGSEAHDGLLIDVGPDSFMSQKPWAVKLCEELGIEDEIIGPSSSQFYMLTGGRLHSVPHELVSLVPSRPEALWKASFISTAGKIRASGEGLVPPRGAIGDESLSSFMRRRFGPEFAAHFAEPLMGGVHAGDPEQMSMAAIYPTFWEMERTHGSITRALLQRRLAGGAGAAPPKSPFVALRHGMQRLVDRLRESLTATRVVLDTSVGRIACSASGRFLVSLNDGEDPEADAVVLTTPAYAAADLVAPLSAAAATRLRSISYASTAVVTLAYRRESIQNPLEGTGFLVPRDQGLPITGCTWSSNKWEGRAPEGVTLMRAFIGHAGDDAVVRRSQEELIAAAHDTLSTVLQIVAAPVYRRVDAWPNAMPQYRVGHLELLSEIEREMEQYPGLLLAGSAYRGVGVPDCVRQGMEAADRAFKSCTANRVEQVSA
ncbi:MAG TPA: protoporphyrinogen oxidase [Chthonomonadaceae bacterium]|nr:protoporphyrinogen oxidase [Chthonomonadaceae bacterium]